MNAWMHVAGWVLVHFLWQGAGLAIAAALLLRLLRQRPATTRYAVSCGTLAAMLVAVGASAVLVNVKAVSHERPRSAEVSIASRASGDVELTIQLGTRNAAQARAFDRGDIEAFFPWLVSIWLAGVAVLLARSAIGWSRVRRLHQRALHAECSAWQAIGARVAMRLGLARVVRIVELPEIDVPFVVGCLRPIVVLPISALSQLNVAQVEAILAHELAHIRRHDYLVNLMQTLAETLLFYHPAVWWVSAQIRSEREHCCDDVAVQLCGDPVGYAEALTELESWRSGGIDLAPAATGGSLLNRVRRILRVELASRSQSPHWALGIVLMAGVLATATVLAQSLDAGHEDVKFEVAAVRPNTSGGPGGKVDMQPGGRFTVVNMPLRNLIINAYGLQASQLVGAPDWIASERYDINAKADGELESPLSREGPPRIQLLMRSLLAERFKLAVHRES